MPQRVKDAFAKSSLVVFEIDMAEMEDPSVLLKMANGMMMPEGTTLKSLLNETDYQKVRKRLAELPYVSLMGDMAEQIKPLFISSMMAKSDVGEEIESYELVLMKMAKDQGKKTAGLESVDFQLGMFDSIPYKDQAEMLVKGLDTDEEAQNKVLDEMVRLYKAEDIGGLQLLIAKEAQGVGNFERLLLDKRNKNWSESMPKIMKQQAAFFAVGAGHLGGPKGVIALLRKSGYNVEAVMP